MVKNSHIPFVKRYLKAAVTSGAVVQTKRKAHQARLSSQPASLFVPRVARRSELKKLETVKKTAEKKTLKKTPASKKIEAKKAEKKLSPKKTAVKTAAAKKVEVSA